MKKIIKIIVFGLLFFILLIGLVFFLLSYMEKSEIKKNNEQIKEMPIEENHSILGLLLNEKQVIIDSLTTMLQENNDSLLNVSLTSDSLSQLVNTQLEKINTDSVTIVKLEKFKSDEKNKKQPKQDDSSKNSMKELAKTYEQMKINEMKPIFAKLDDKTIISLYNNMSGRKRPLILKALSTDRAAKITKQLAK